MGQVDNRSPELAYATKDNIAHPGSAAEVTAAQNRAGDVARLNTPPRPSPKSGTTNVETTTLTIRRANP